MRKPRQVWTPEELAEIERRAQANFELLVTEEGLVSWETCYMLAEMGYIQKKLDEIKRWLFNG